MDENEMKTQNELRDELNAMEKIASVLDPLTPEQSYRIIAWASERNRARAQEEFRGPDSPNFIPRQMQRSR